MSNKPEYGSAEYYKKRETILELLEAASEHLGKVEELLKQITDPNVNADTTRIRMMDARGRISNTLVYLYKKWKPL